MQLFEKLKLILVQDLFFFKVVEELDSVNGVICILQVNVKNTLFISFFEHLDRLYELEDVHLSLAPTHKSNLVFV